MTGSTSAVLSALLLLAVAGATRAAPAHYAPAPCTGDFDGVAQTVQCGVLSVDEARGGRGGRRVALPVAIVRAAHPRAGLPPVIYLHGGPGGSAIQSLPEMLKSPIGRELVGQDQDWIFFDQRGGRLATPELDCGSAPLNDAGPLTESAVRTLQACGARQTASGVDLSRYNSAEVARDVQDLRRALGLKSFDLFGISYGTRVGFAVLTHAPQGVRAVVLDSVWPPNIGWAVGGPQMVSNAVKAIFARCAADPTCHAAYPTPAAQLDTLSKRLLVAPMMLVDGHTYTASDLGGFLMDTAYDPEGARSLPHDADAFSRGDFTALNAQIADRSEYTEAQHLAFLCKERFPFERRDQVTAAADDPVGQTTVASFQRYFDVCPAYAVGRAEAVENAPVSSPVPTLFLSAEFDPGCPPELARAAAQRFTHGQFVMVPNTTHGIFENSACGRRMIRAFYANPSAAPDASCLHPEHDRFTFRLK